MLGVTGMRAFSKLFQSTLLIFEFESLTAEQILLCYEKNYKEAAS